MITYGFFYLLVALIVFFGGRWCINRMLIAHFNAKRRGGGWLLKSYHRHMKEVEEKDRMRAEIEREIKPIRDKALRGLNAELQAGLCVAEPDSESDLGVEPEAE